MTFYKMARFPHWQLHKNIYINKKEGRKIQAYTPPPPQTKSIYLAQDASFVIYHAFLEVTAKYLNFTPGLKSPFFL